MAEELANLGLTPWVYENPQKYEAFWFEQQDGNELRFWLRQQMPYISILCVVYFIFIFVGPSLMKNRKAFDLRITYFAFNVFMACFCIFGASRVSTTIFDILRRPDGIHRSLCYADSVHYSETFWGLLFCLSKIAELFDTVLIVLRKKPLLFIHWFHHLSMLYMTSYVYSEGEPVCRCMVLINFSVHGLLYTYFAIKALNINIPQSVSMAVHGVHILQFVTMILLNLYTFNVKVNGGECFRTVGSMKIITVVVSIYLIFTLRFFVNRYILTTKHKIE